MIAHPPKSNRDKDKGGGGGETKGGFGSKTPLSPEKWKRTGTARKKRGEKKMIKTEQRKLKDGNHGSNHGHGLFCVCLG